MGLSEKIMKELETMNDMQLQAVLDFSRNLHMQEERELDDLMDRLVDENIEALEELAK